jgi:RNA polymerase sigma factor (sigma-70 family)
MLSRNDCALLERLWREQARAMRAFLILRTGDPAEADDTVAEVYWRASRALARGLPPRRNPRGWLWQILHCYRIDQARRQGRRPVVHGLDKSDGAAYEGPDPIRVDERTRLHAALRRLPPRQAAVLVLRYARGYRLREIAGLLGVTYGATRALHHRAVAGMRAMLITQ